MKLNAEEILKLVDEGYLIMNKHPEEDLFILNYSKTAQYEQYWNEYTLMCRGLVVDVDFNVVSRCLPKFFNLEEPQNKGKIPTDLPFEAFEKMDGSCIYLFNYKDRWIGISRGSFISDQANKANEILKTKNLNLLDKSKTYMFEIIY